MYIAMYVQVYIVHLEASIGWKTNDTETFSLCA